MTRSFPQDEYFVEWQIPDEPGTFIDLVTEVPEVEVLSIEENEVRSRR
jgi:hypothetical protein